MTRISYYYYRASYRREKGERKKERKKESETERFKVMFLLYLDVKIKSVRVHLRCTEML